MEASVQHGKYSLQVSIDGISSEEIYRVDVEEKKRPPNKLRKYIAKNSAGLRIRLQPTLQSEQYDGIISLISMRNKMMMDFGFYYQLNQLYNIDGIQLKLGVFNTINKF